MKELTKAEEQVMQVLWHKGKTTVKNVLEELPAPTPAYNTVSTIIRILEKKGFVDHEPLGRGYLYFTTISKKEYTKKFMKNFIGNYFGNSFKDMVSFFAKSDQMDIETFEQMMDEIKEDLNKKR